MKRLFNSLDERPLLGGVTFLLNVLLNRGVAHFPGQNTTGTEDSNRNKARGEGHHLNLRHRS